MLVATKVTLTILAIGVFTTALKVGSSKATHAYQSQFSLWTHPRLYTHLLQELHMNFIQLPASRTLIHTCSIHAPSQKAQDFQQNIIQEVHNHNFVPGSSNPQTHTSLTTPTLSHLVVAPNHYCDCCPTRMTPPDFPLRSLHLPLGCPLPWYHLLLEV